MNNRAKSTPLPAPARYFPLSGGVFGVRADLSPLGRDFGQGRQDHRQFQLDCEFPRYRDEKQAARRESIGKYVQTSDHFAGIAPVVTHFMQQRLTAEYPEYFSLEDVDSGRLLRCKLTGEVLQFGTDNLLTDTLKDDDREDKTIAGPAYHSAWDAVGAQVQEDLCVISRTDRGNEICALHLCLPNYWAAEDKLGQDFANAHKAVAGMAHINAGADKLLEMLVRKGPFVRFAWGLTTDDRLNHHPCAPAGIDPQRWQGRRFRPDAPELFLRVERQVLWAIPEVESALFTIRTYLTPCEDFFEDEEKRVDLVSSLQTMPTASRRYKGLEQDAESIIAWLNRKRHA